MGCEFDVVTQSEAVDEVLSWTQAPIRSSHHIITVNVAILMMARNDVRLASAISHADLVVVDGKPLVWASRWLGTPLPERVSGADLMQRLLEVGNVRGLRVFFLGTTQERLDSLERVVRNRYPGLVIVGARNGFFGQDEYASITTQIRNAEADILLVGMPAPFKEVWCEDNREALATPAILGVGGAFDVVAGFVPRAPRWVQEAGMEWAWRLAMEPRKLWKRYLVTNSAFIVLLTRRLLKREVSVSATTPNPATRQLASSRKERPTRMAARRLKFMFNQRVRGFEVPDRPWFDSNESTAWFLAKLADAGCYLEYGSGGSTFSAAQLGVNFVTVDSDRFFLRSVRRKIDRSGFANPSKQFFHHADIGPTGPWGHPVGRFSESRLQKFRRYSDPPATALSRLPLPDLVLVDGRFRVACALKAVRMLEGQDDWTIIVDDYIGRPSYEAIAEFAHVEKFVGRMAVFRKSKDVDPEILDAAIRKYEVIPD